MIADPKQAREWQALHDNLDRLLASYGTKDGFGNADYSLANDNWGQRRQSAEIRNLNFLRPEVVEALQVLLFDLPDWRITMTVAAKGLEDLKPRMGLVIYYHEVTDELQRELLPEEFRNLTYRGASAERHFDEEQDLEWHILHGKITATMNRHGVKDYIGRGDYWLVDDNWGWSQLNLEIQNLKLYEPRIVEELRLLLADYPGWRVAMQVDVIGKQKAWPGMGILIYRDKVVDELQRDFLPEVFRSWFYGP